MIPSDNGTKNNVLTESASTTTTIEKVVFERRFINVTKIINVLNITNLTHILNETVYYHENLTKVQMKYLKNMKPDTCYTIGCSQGYHKCKVDMFDILSIDQPRFSERPSIGYNPRFERKNNTNHVFPIYNDGLGDYLKINGTYWYMTYGVNYTLNKTQYNYTDFKFNFDDIKLRRI